MKKLFLFAIAAVAVSFASCSGKTSTQTTEGTQDSVQVEEIQQEAVLVDSVSNDTVVVSETAVEAAPVK